MSFLVTLLVLLLSMLVCPSGCKLFLSQTVHSHRSRTFLRSVIECTATDYMIFFLGGSYGLVDTPQGRCSLGEEAVCLVSVKSCDFLTHSTNTSKFCQTQGRQIEQTSELRYDSVSCRISVAHSLALIYRYM